MHVAAPEVSSARSDEKGQQRRIDEELGNLSQKIEKIVLKKWCESKKDITFYNCREVSHISQNCMSEKVPKKENEKKGRASHYIEINAPYNNDEG
ncbi:74_t:CDS:2 [Gigaspora margarita]|uniref:74_t:CDS:1 n=1 Tax=Gigaspora margarita TaxID=4874 RepID=A0ABN7V310_GIGMA|nr:74_t:CDS:2 [Gigaspora margarita]